MQTYGPVSLLQVEQWLGEATCVRLARFASSALPLAAGEAPLRTIGMIWPCGCELLGTGTPHSEVNSWVVPCAEHAHALELDTERTLSVPEPAELGGSVIADIGDVTCASGEFVVMDDAGTITRRFA